MATTKFLGATTVKFLGTSTLKFVDSVNKIWVYFDSTISSTAYSSDYDAIVSGSSGCAIPSEGLAVLPSASGYGVGNIARLTVFDDELNPCGTYFWYEVQLA
jgi:hypothetical protein